MKQNKITSLLGIAMKAGKIASGEFMTENAIKDGSAFLVILANDSSDNTKKKFRNSCEYYQVPYIELVDKEELGRCIGKEFRASLAVTDPGFAKTLMSYVDKNQESM